MECKECKSKELEDKLIDTDYVYNDYFKEDIKMGRAAILEEPQNCIDYEKEYARLYEENINLKIENETLKETIVKLAVRM